jgi:hypothetical protein
MAAGSSSHSRQQTTSELARAAGSNNSQPAFYIIVPVTIPVYTIMAITSVQVASTLIVIAKYHKASIQYVTNKMVICNGKLEMSGVARFQCMHRGK